MSVRPMRRQDRAISREDAIEILHVEEYGILSTVGEDGLPYSVPLSYVMDADAIYFHCANTGHKLDNIQHQPQVAFLVVGPTTPVFNGSMTSLYESVMVQGTAARVEDDTEKRRIMKILCQKYFPNHMDQFEHAMRALPVTDVWRISMDQVSGKANR